MRRPTIRGVARAARTRLVPAPAPTPQRLELDYLVDPVARHGWGRPGHSELTAILEQGEDRYREVLAVCSRHAEALGRVPLVSTGDREPMWHNDYFTGLDIVALYSLLAHHDPATFLEVGSGFSTRVARRAIDDQRLRTTIVSIDPQPRSPLSAVTDDYLCQSLEDTDLHVFERLSPGDFLFFDGSHRVFTNSDATVFFTEVLPRIKPGVLIHVHDVFLPWDYIPGWAGRWYSEQYLLASWLLAGDQLEVVLPSFYVSLRPELHHLVDPVFDQLIWSGIATNGSSFWFRRAGPG